MLVAFKHNDAADADADADNSVDDGYCKCILLTVGRRFQKNIDEIILYTSES